MPDKQIGLGKLTALQVKRLAARPEHLLVNDGGGLYLQVTPKGASWIFRYRLSPTRLRDHGLGPLHTLSLSEAREKARECRKLRLAGLDPIEERKRRRQQAALEAATALSFRQAAERYIRAHSVAWRNPVHIKQWPASLEMHVFPVFGDLPLSAIDTGLVLKAIEPIWVTKPVTAARVRGRIESILSWAASRGYRPAGDNPARWKGHLENLLPRTGKIRRVAHHAALPYAEVADFVGELRQRDGVPVRALEFLVLTAARAGEVTGARWDEINLQDRSWTVPAERMKGGREHRVPLSDAAMAIVDQMAALRRGDLLFPGSAPGRPINHGQMLKTVRNMGCNASVHGFRSSFRVWCAERTNFPREIAEIALAHQVGSAVEQAYARSDMFDKRRQLAEAWARYCGQPAAPEGKVIAIGAR
jgi:integrase